MYAESKIIILPRIIYISGISLNTITPIEIAKNILVYSNGATNEGLEYFTAVIEQNWVVTPSIPIMDISIKSFRLIACQPLILNKHEAMVIPTFVYSIIVTVES